MKLGTVSNRKILRQVSVLALCVAAGWFLKGRLTPAVQVAGAGQQEPYVLIQGLKKADISPKTSYIGHVEAIKSVNLTPQVTGYVEKVLFQEGSFVNEGDLLFVIEQKRYLANVELRKAELQSAKANLVRAERDFKRQAQLSKQNYASKATFDTAESTYLQAKAAVAQAEANLDLAEIDLGYTEVKAPISGLIGTVEPTKGDYVSPAGTTLMTIIQTTPIQVVFSITDKEYVSAISETGSAGFLSNEKITLQLADGNIYAFSGSYQYTDNISDSQTNSVGVYVNFENPQNILLPNTYVTVYRSKELKDVVLIPQNQVDLTPEGNFITLADKHGIHRQKIEILDTQGSDYIIKNTFKPKQYLVKGKAPLLKPNQAFRLNIVSENGG